MDSGAELVIAVITSIFSAGMAYGILRVKIAKLEDEMDTMVNRCDVSHEKLDRELVYRENKWVTKDTFNAVIGPINHALEELQRDVKKILTLVSHQSD